MTSPTLPRLSYSIADVATATGLSARTIERAIANGNLPSVRPSPGRRVVLAEDLHAWLRRDTTTPRTHAAREVNPT